nr:MAG TPA: protein of unknown function (DUF3552) [Caudoviricetes sp.]
MRAMDMIVAMMLLALALGLTVGYFLNERW